MTWIDYSVIIVFLLFITGIGLYFSKRASKNTSEFILAGRKLPWWLAGTSMLASRFNANPSLHTTRKIHETGLSGAWFYWSASVGGVLKAVFWNRLWRRTEITTPLEYFEIRYSAGPAKVLRTVSALSAVFFNAGVIVAISLIAMQKLAAVLLGLPETVVWFGIALPSDFLVTLAAVALALVYSAAAGVYSVVWTDLIEFGVALLGTYVLFVLVSVEVGSPSVVWAKLEAAGAAAGDATSLLPGVGPTLVVFFLLRPVLEAFTWLYGRDVEALTLLADLYQRQGRQREAVEALHAVIAAAADPEVAAQARRRIRLLVESTAATLAGQGDRAGVIELYRDVLALDPLNHRYRYLLAVWLGRAGEHDAALEALAQIPAGALPERDVDALERRLEADSRMASRYGGGLPLRAHGEHYVVEAATGRGQRLRLLIDTGASLTVLKPAVIGAISGARSAGRTVRIGTANGVVQAPLFHIPRLELGPYRVERPRVAVMELDEVRGVDGLLGMESLRGFDYQIDRGAERLRLSRREPSP